jgi:phosphoglycerate dehydrogenase-like enzyme
MRVAVLDDYQRVARDMGPWDTLGPDVEVDFFADHVAEDDALITRLEPYEAVVAMRERTPFGRARLERLPNLRLLVTTGMGNASIDVGAAGELGIVVSGTGSLATPTAELTWGLILALTRSICAEDREVRAGGWQHTIGPELAGRTLGIVGLGRLGGRMAAIAHAFEMDVIAWSQNLRPERAVEVGAEAVSREDLFARADVVTIHLKLSDRTRGLIGAADLARMKRSAYLVNTSRGPIVDEAALLDALHGGRIAGAALDVFAYEPLPPDSVLPTLKNVVLTPHNAGGIGGWHDVFARIANNLQRVQAGRAPVTWDIPPE